MFKFLCTNKSPESWVLKPTLKYFTYCLDTFGAVYILGAPSDSSGADPGLGLLSSMVWQNTDFQPFSPCLIWNVPFLRS